MASRRRSPPRSAWSTRRRSAPPGAAARQARRLRARRARRGRARRAGRCRCRRGSGTTTVRRSRRRARAASGRWPAPTPRSVAVGARRSGRRGRASRSVVAAGHPRARGAGDDPVHPYEEPAWDLVELCRRRPHGDRHRSRRHGRASRPWRTFAAQVAAALPATACTGSATAAIPTASYAGWRSPAARVTSCSTSWPRQRCRRLRHPRPAAPSGRGVAGDRAAPPWWTSRTGRPSGPGCPVVQARLAEALGDTVETRVSTDRHRPLDPRIGA